MILRFLSTLPDAFASLFEEMYKILDKISHRRNVNASDCFFNIPVEKLILFDQSCPER